jgi:dihydrolipoamide dehydrogenase
MKTCDILIIGAGPAGYCAALSAAQKKKHVVLVTNDDTGGTCLHRGCIPTKALLKYSALQYELSHLAPEIAWNPSQETALARTQNSIASLRRGLEKKLLHAGVTLVHEKAHPLPSKGPFPAAACGKDIHSAPAVLIAAGGVPKKQHPKFSQYTGRVLTQNDYFSLPEEPAVICIAGASFTGLELAQIYKGMGHFPVLVEKQSRPLPTLDAPLIRPLVRQMKKDKIPLYCSSTVKNAAGCTITLSTPEKKIPLQASVFVDATGADTPLSGQDFSPWGIESPLRVNRYLQTQNPRIYAAGDVAGFTATAHGAFAEAEIALQNMLGAHTAVDHSTLPAVVYTTPEIFSVGLTELRAQKENIPCELREKRLGENGRCAAEYPGESGLVRALLSPDGDILGMQMTGPLAGEIASLCAMMVQLKMNRRDIASCVFPHPTISEIIKDCILS